MRRIPLENRLIGRIRESGAIYTLQIILNDHVPDSVWRGQKVTIWARHLKDADADIPLDGRFRWADVSDTDLLRRAGFSADDLQARFAASCRAAILEEGGELLAASWYLPARPQPWEYAWFEFDLPQSAMWNFDVWVSPPHRGKGIGGRMIAFAHAKLREAGRDSVYCTIDWLNRNSKTMFGKAGYRPVGEFLFIKLFGFMLLRTENALRWGRLRPEARFFVPLHHEFVGPEAVAQPHFPGQRPHVR